MLTCNWPVVIVSEIKSLLFTTWPVFAMLVRITWALKSMRSDKIFHSIHDSHKHREDFKTFPIPFMRYFEPKNAVYACLRNGFTCMRYVQSSHEPGSNA